MFDCALDPSEFQIYEETFLFFFISVEVLIQYTVFYSAETASLNSSLGFAATRYRR
jgi:hypothetical protein